MQESPCGSSWTPSVQALNSLVLLNSVLPPCPLGPCRDTSAGVHCPSVHTRGGAPGGQESVFSPLDLWSRSEASLWARPVPCKCLLNEWMTLVTHRILDFGKGFGGWVGVEGWDFSAALQRLAQMRRRSRMNPEADAFQIWAGTCRSYHPLILPVFPENHPDRGHHGSGSASHTDAWMWSPWVRSMTRKQHIPPKRLLVLSGSDDHPMRTYPWRRSASARPGKRSRTSTRGRARGRVPPPTPWTWRARGAAKSPLSLAQTVVLWVGCPCCPLPGCGRKSKAYRRLLLL